MTSIRLSELLGFIHQINFTRWLTFVIISLSLIFLYSYSYQNADLSDQVERLSDEVSKLSVPAIGDALPGIVSVNVEGNFSSFNFDDSRKHIIFVYSVHCQFCKEDFPLWNRLIGDISKENSNVHALSLDSQPETQSGVGKEFENLRNVTIIGAETNVRRTYRTGVTPAILITSHNGVIEWMHVGRLDGDDIKEIQQKLGSVKS